MSHESRSSFSEISKTRLFGRNFGASGRGLFLLGLMLSPVAAFAASNKPAPGQSNNSRASMRTPAASNKPATGTTAAEDTSDLDLGWKLALEWKSEEAIKHFDKASAQGLKTNYRLAWGYGVAYAQLSRFPESEKWFEKAVGQYASNSRLLCDYGFLYMSWGLYDARTAKKVQDQQDASRYFVAAETKFIDAAHLAPKESLPMTRLAMLSFYQGKYEQSWKFVKISRKLGGEDLDSRFLADLASRLPEPK